MRKRVGQKNASQRDTRGNANMSNKSRETGQVKLVKPILKPTKTPTGKGLGKAGARRLGRLLKRAIQPQEEQQPAVRGKVTLPKTPVRLFKHQVQKEAENSPNKKTAKPASAQVSRLILSVVSQCKHRGGISMADLKQTLAAEGYNVSRNNKQVNVVTKRLVNNETHARATRSATFKLNKKQADTNHTRPNNTIPKKPKKDLKQRKRANKSPKGVEKSQRPARRSVKHRGKSYNPKGKTQKITARSPKPRGRTRKPAAKSHTPKRKTRRGRRRMPKPARRNHRTATTRVAQGQKAPRTTERAQKNGSRQNRHSYRSPRTTRQPHRRRAHKTGSRVNARKYRATRRRTCYY